MGCGERLDASRPPPPRTYASNWRRASRPARRLTCSTSAAEDVANYAKAGNLLDYGESLSNAADFYQTLKDSFTYDGKFYCAPKDFSTLALFINTDMWKAAGLTDADIPKDWAGLEAAAKKLTAAPVSGLSISPERDRLDAFLVQNGGYLVDDAGAATANSQENIDALAFVKKLYTDGSLKWPKELGASWAGEAFGKGQAAMTIEGNWLLGALKTDYPELKYTVAELPAGPDRRPRAPCRSPTVGASRPPPRALTRRRHSWST